MAIDKAIRNRIIRNALLSLLLYSLPVIALFIYLRVTGEKPWHDKAVKPYLKQIERYKEKNNSI